MGIPSVDSGGSDRTSLNVKAAVAFTGALVATTIGVVAVASVEFGSSTQVTILVVGLIVEFSVAAIAYRALKEMSWFSPTVEVRRYNRTLATTALAISVAAILTGSWFVWIMGTNVRVQL